MATNFQLQLAAPLKSHFQLQRATSLTKFPIVRCSATTTPSIKKTFNVTLLPGDGIGPEIISVSKHVLRLAASLEEIEIKYQEMPVGGCAIDLTGVPLPEETLTAAKQSDAILLGAIGGYKWDNREKRLKPETGLLQLRAGLDVFANLRPAIVLPQIDRIARVAFETARRRRGKLCSIDKANVLEASMLWRRRVTEMGAEYSDVELSHMYTDNAAMQLIRDPKQFDTILTNNIFGDILSDEASMISGSIGLLPFASIGQSGPGLFEPIHCSAPDIVGQDKANPLATILSAAMLLRYGLGESKAAERIEAAVMETLDRGSRTGDIYSSGNKLVGCKEMGEQVMKSLDSHIYAVV